MTRKRVGLSPRHKKILSFLEAFQAKNGYPPSIREIGDHTQISSTSVVNYYLNQLEEMHYIERVSNVSRGINLLKTSKGNSVKNPMTAVTDFADQLISIPLVGNIIAGEPMPVPASDFSYYDSESGIDIARSLLPAGDHPEDLYALRVHGDSMIDAMVNDGDETTLKYFYLENGQVRLQPANPTMKPIIIRDPSIVEVQGKVVLVIRQLDQ